MRVRKLSQLISIKGGSPVPLYEIAILPRVRALVDTALSARTDELSLGNVLEALHGMPLPDGWESVFAPKKAMPQWALSLDPAAVQAELGIKTEVPLRTYFGVATAKTVSKTLRSLYVRDLPIDDEAPGRFEELYGDHAAWLTLFVFLKAPDPRWNVFVKPSHKVDGRMTLEAEVLGQDLM